MTKVEDFATDLPLLVEMGLIAIKQGDEESAKKIFNAVGLLEPGGTAKKMGYGLIAVHKMEIKTARKHFNEILQADKTNWRAQAFLAFTHMLSLMQEGTDEDKLEALKTSAELSTEVLEKSDDPSTCQLAQSILDWEKDMSAKVQEEKGPVK